jgi:hypothetical protein
MSVLLLYSQIMLGEDIPLRSCFYIRICVQCNTVFTVLTISSDGEGGIN